MEKNPYLSVIIPLYNEEESIELLYKAILDAVESMDVTYEILFVDDGSKDATFEKGTKLAEMNPNLRMVKFRRNYGQTPAMVAGIDLAKGEVLVTMDGDLQNDPSDIPKFVERIKAGYDLAVGWRYKRQDKLITRKIPSKIANWLIGKVTGVPIKDNGCSLKAYRRDVIKNVPLYSEMHRFIPAMSSLVGAKVAEIKAKHHARQFGASKYGLSRIYKVLMDLLTIKMVVSFTTEPLRWFGLFSMVFFFIAFLLTIFGIQSSIVNPGESIIVTIGGAMLFGGAAIFLLLMGLLANFIYKTGDVNTTFFSGITAKFEKFE